jgi:hypothetical protein
MKKKKLTYTTKAKFAKEFGMTPQNIASWIKQNKIKIISI